MQSTILLTKKYQQWYDALTETVQSGQLITGVALPVYVYFFFNIFYVYSSPTRGKDSFGKIKKKAPSQRRSKTNPKT